MSCAERRVLSLDQCADQYVLALSPRTDIVGLSTRATDYDSYLAASAVGLPIRRATLESALAARPTIIVRYWGGDARLVTDLAHRGARVVTIDDSADFAGVRANIRRVAAILAEEARGEALIDRMNRRLSAARVSRTRRCAPQRPATGVQDSSRIPAGPPPGRRTAGRLAQAAPPAAAAAVSGPFSGHR